MEMKPVRPIRDRLALEAGAVWTYQRGQLMVKVPLTELRAIVLALRGVSMQTDLEIGEPLFDLLEDMQHVLDRMIISRLAGPVEGTADRELMDREFPPIRAILEGQ